MDSRVAPDGGNPPTPPTRTPRHRAASRWSSGGGEWLEPLPSQEALRESGELAFPVLDEVALGHEVVELLALLRHHDPRVLLHAQLQAYSREQEGS